MWASVYMMRLSWKSHLVLVEKHGANSEVSSSRKGWSITRSRWGLILRVSLCFRSHPRPQVLAPLPPPPPFIPHFKSFPKPPPPISHPIHFLQSRCSPNPYCGSAWQRASSKTSTCYGCARDTSKKNSLKKIIWDIRRHGEFYVLYSSVTLRCQKPVSIK